MQSADVTGAPAPSSDDDDDDNTAAIVGGVIGGVAGVALLGAGAAYAMKKRKASNYDSQPATGTKRGEVMYSANPAFAEEAPAAAAPVVASGKPPVPPLDTAKAQRSASIKSPKDYANPMFSDVNVDTPKGPNAASGANPLYDTGNSQLSVAGDGDNVYATAKEGSSAPVSARMDSARSGIQSNPIFADAAAPPNIMDSGDDFKDANPLFESARSGTDIMESAQSDLLDSKYDTKYDTAADASLNTGTSIMESLPDRPSGPSAAINPLFGAEAPSASEGANPLFETSQDQSGSLSARRQQAAAAAPAPAAPKSGGKKQSGKRR